MDNNNQKNIALSLMEEQEKANRAAMLQEQIKSDMQQQKIADRTITPNIRPGYVEVFWETLPSKGMFQPKGARLFITAAKSEQVFAWSSINENDAASVNENINNIIKTCVEYIPATGRIGNWMDLRECDRVPLLLMIRDLTFPEPENKLNVEAPCVSDEKCGSIKIEVNSRNLEMVEIDSKYFKFYDEQSRSFKFKTRSGIDFETTIPSIGVIQKVIHYVSERERKKSKINESLVNILPFLFADHRDFDSQKVLEVEADVMLWNIKKVSAIVNIVKALRMGTTTNLKTNCAKCGKEVVAPMSFRGGFRDLFVLSDFDSDLLF